MRRARLYSQPLINCCSRQERCAFSPYLRVEVEDADLARVDDFVDRVDRRPVQGLLVRAVLDEA